MTDVYPKAEYNKIYDYISGIDLDSVKLVFCEQFDAESKIWNFDKHDHDYIEFIFFLDGRARIDVPGKQVNLLLYDLIAYPPGVLHQEFLDPRSHQEIICLGVEVESESTLNTSFELSDQSNKYCWLFTQIYDEYSAKNEGFEELISSYLKTLFLLLKRSYNEPCYEDMEVFNRCLHYIHDHYLGDLNIGKLSSLAYVSPSYLNRIFKKQLGISPMHYVNYCRIENAKRLLRSSSYSITEIASNSGIKDQKYFSRIFRKFSGQSPSEYRKALREEL